MKSKSTNTKIKGYITQKQRPKVKNETAMLDLKLKS